MSPTSGEMSDTLEAGTEHAVDGEKNPPEEDEKALAEEEDKKEGDGIGIYINPEGKEVTEQITLSGITLQGQELKHFVCAEKTQASADIEEPTREDDSAKDASEKPQLKKKKEKKRKRSEHEQTKIEYPILSCIARDVLAIQASTVASESSFSAGGRIISDHRSRLKSDTVEALLCLQDWLNAVDPKPTNKYVEEEEYLVFYQESECDDETAEEVQ